MNALAATRDAGDPAVREALAGPRLHIDLGAVAANTRLLAARAAALMAVVKADGFGHGAADVARTALAHGAVALGVATLAEGTALRAHGIAAPVLSWLNPVDADFDTAHEMVPPWRFVAGPSPLGVGWRAGALAPSIDGAGRRFVLSLGVDGLSPAEAGDRGARLAEAAEAALYSALAEGLTADAVVQGLARDLGDGIAAPIAEAAPSPPASGGVWWSDGSGLEPRSGALPPADLLVRLPPEPDPIEPPPENAA